MATYVFWFDALPGRNDITAKVGGQTGGAYVGSGTAVEDATDKGRYSLTLNLGSALASGVYLLSGYIGAQAGFAKRAYNVTAVGNQLPMDEIPSAGASPVNVTVLPVALQQLSQDEQYTLKARTGEQRVIAFVVQDADGAEVDLDGKTLRIVIESQTDATVEYVIEDGSITHSNGSVAFTLPSAVTVAERVWNWSLRDVSSGDTVLKDGPLVVTYSPKKN